MIEMTVRDDKSNERDLSELGRYKITCTHCGTQLGHLVETDRKTRPYIKTADQTKYICFCPCGNECFAVKTNRPASVITHNEYMVLDVQSDVVKEIIKVKIGKVT